jgi:hypothetical protein
MATPKTNWTDIEIDTEGDSSIEDIVLELSNEEPKRTEVKKAETHEDEEDFSERSEGKGRFAKVQTETREAEVTESDEDMQLKPNKAFKRIKGLLSRNREQEEIIQKQHEVIKHLSQNSKQFEKKNIEAQKATWERTVESKQNELEKAMSENDPKEVAKLTRELADAQMRFSAMQAVEEDFDETVDVPEPPRAQTQEGPPEAAQEWVARNQWFFKDKEKHFLARTLSSTLQQEGKYDPESEEYWDELDRRLLKYNIKGGTKDARKKVNNDIEEVEEVEERPAPNKRKGSPVSSSRSFGDEDGGGRAQFTRTGNKVSATPSQDDIEMAEKMGVGLADFMKEKFKYAAQGYKGYVPIDIT